MAIVCVGMAGGYKKSSGQKIHANVSVERLGEDYVHATHKFLSSLEA